MILYNPTVSGSLAVTGSLTTTGTITSQTLVVQTITSSIEFNTGSTRNGSLAANTHEFTGSVLMTGSLSVVTTGTELQVNASGVNIGNALTDNHIISGSVRINPNGLFVSSSGFVGIGTTSPSQLLEVVGGEIKAGRVDSSNEGGQVSFGRSTDNATSWYIDNYGNAASTQLRFVNVTNAVVAMTITGSNVGIGTSTPSGGISGNELALHLVHSNVPILALQSTAASGKKWQIYSSNDGSLYFRDGTAGTHVFNLQTNGDVLIGNTDGSGKLVIAGDDNNYILRSRNTSASGNYQFYIQHSLGNVSMGNQRGTVAYNNSSDYRLKEDLKSFNGLDILSNINFYDFKWKESQIRNYGVIAHELQEVIPYLVEGNKDELFEDGSIKSQQVDITKLIPILGKAIQEQQAKITALEEILQRNNIQ